MRIEDHGSSFAGISSVRQLPKLNVYTDGRILVMRREPSETVHNQFVTRQYTFNSADEAETWYENCKKDAVKTTKAETKKSVIHGMKT